MNSGKKDAGPPSSKPGKSSAIKRVLQPSREDDEPDYTLDDDNDDGTNEEFEAKLRNKAILANKKLHQSPEAVQSSAYMMEVFLNDRLGKKIKVKCNSDDTVGDLKKLVAAQIGSRPEKLRIQKWYTVFKDHISLEDYEVTNGMSLELYYN